MMMVQIQWNASTSEFEGTALCANKPYRLSVLDVARSDEQQAVQQAAEIADWIEQHLDVVRQFAAAGLVELKNEVWRTEAEPLVGEEDFSKTIELQGVLAFAIGGFSLFFNDHDLFWGHAIKVNVDQAFKLEGVEIVG